MSADREPPAPALEVSSGVSIFDVRPFIRVAWGEQTGQWTPAEARQHALQVLEVAEAAEHDSVVVRWLRERVHVDVDRVGQMLKDLRHYRDAQR